VIASGPATLIVSGGLRRGIVTGWIDPGFGTAFSRSLPARKGRDEKRRKTVRRRDSL
jgi:hypothetical protein